MKKKGISWITLWIERKSRQNLVKFNLILNSRRLHTTTNINESLIIREGLNIFLFRLLKSKNFNIITFEKEKK